MESTSAREATETFVRALPAIVAAHRTADGGYGRLLDAAVGTDAGSDVYGIAAAVGILHSIGSLPDPDDGRRLATLLARRRSADGTFPDPSHGAVHSTATAIGALVLLGATPTPEPRLIADAWNPHTIGPFLAGLDWSQPWPSAHDAAGIAALATMTGAATPASLDAYFAWLDAEADPGTGLWRAGSIGAIDEAPGLFGNLGGSFHMHFIYAWHGRPIPHPAAVVDSGLRLFDETAWILSDDVGWPQLDWTYSVRRAAAQSQHRESEVRQRIERLAVTASESLARRAVDPSTPSDLHTLGAQTALVAELTAAVPGLAGRHRVEQVLESRPFI